MSDVFNSHMYIMEDNEDKLEEFLSDELNKDKYNISSDISKINSIFSVFINDNDILSSTLIRQIVSEFPNCTIDATVENWSDSTDYHFLYSHHKLLIDGIDVEGEPFTEVLDYEDI